MTSATGTRSSRRGGFTLLELIAVLVLISTVLAIAAPSLRGFARGRQTDDAALRILALTRLARSRSASWGAVHRLNVDPDARQYWLTMQRQGAFVEIDSDHGRRYNLPAGVSVKVDSSSDDDGVPYIQFDPNGRCDPATVQLTGGQGDVRQVTCESASERFRIVTPAEDDRI